ncbi:MAG: ABC transporter substrate-binding protein [Treponema sp.]|nr:ABC transporter substrate-binding protein [Treponema sp.]
MAAYVPNRETGSFPGRFQNPVKFSQVFVICLSLVVFAGCREDGGPESDALYEETLTIAVMQESPSLDLHKNSTLIARQIGDGTIWEKLVTLSSASEAVPELAERFETGEGGRSLTFYLRRGVPFHDGSIMDAEDVISSLNRWIESFSSVREMAGASRFEKVDDYTVRIRFENPALSFPEIMAGSAQPAVITTAEACGDEDERGFLRRYIGTGPFKFAEWKLNQYILLERFDSYAPYGDPDKPADGWAVYKKPAAEKICFQIVPQSATRLAGLETGQFQADYNLVEDDLPRLKAMKDVETVSYQAGSMLLIFNKKQGLGTNLYFRQAINAALDAEEILKACFGEEYSLNSSYMEDPESFWFSRAGAEYYNRRDIALARELLKKADYRGEVLRILISNMGTFDRGALVLKQQLEALEIPVELEIVDWAAMLQYRNDPSRYDIFITNFVSVPSPLLKLFFGPSYPGWSEDETLQHLVRELTSAENREEAKQRWDNLQGYCWVSLPVINVGHFGSTHAWNKKLENIITFKGLYFWNAGLRK